MEKREIKKGRIHRREKKIDQNVGREQKVGRRGERGIKEFKVCIRGRSGGRYRDGRNRNSD